MNYRSGRVVRRLQDGSRAVESLERRWHLTGVSLGNPISLSTTSDGLSPVAAGLADFNGDGKADLYVANSSGSASVLLSNGDGSFATPVTIPVAGTPASIATGRFDGTGHTDLVVGTDGSPGDVSIILGNGNGTFQAANNVPALNNNSALAVGDFNNDGYADVLTVSNSPTSSNNAELVLGNGSGGATAQAPFSLPFGSVSAVAVGDFNGDGNLDFAVANAANNSVSVFLGNGNGTFHAPVTFSAGPNPTSIVVGDFNGRTLSNGQPALDIVTADSTGREVSFLANDGSGGFAAPVTSPVSGSPTNGGPIEIRVANFTGSTTPEDLVALLSGGSQADVLLGNGNGTFRAGTTAATTGGLAIAAGDVRGVGLSDVVVAGNSEIQAFPNLGGNTPSPTASVDPSQAAGTLGSTTYDFTVTYLDPLSVRASTLGNGNLVVTFPGGSQQAGTLVSTGLSNAPIIDATYQISYPAGLTSGDAGAYTVSVNANSVMDSGNVSVAAGEMGQFTLGFSTQSPPPPPPTTTSTLVPTLGLVRLAAEVVAGSKLNASVPVLVTNDGATLKGKVTVDLYADAGATLDGNQILLATSARAVVLRAGGRAAFPFSVRALPAALPDGTYDLIGQVIDPSGGTNVVATSQTVQVAAPFVQPTLSVGAVVPATIAIDRSGSVLVTVTNQGDVPSTGGQITLSLSPDGVNPLPGVTLTTVRAGLAIAAGKSRRFRLPFKLTSAIPSGSYVPLVTVSLSGVSITAAGPSPFSVT